MQVGHSASCGTGGIVCVKYRIFPGTSYWVLYVAQTDPFWHIMGSDLNLKSLLQSYSAGPSRD